MPIFSLSPAIRPAPESLGGVERVDDAITVVHLVYGTSAEVETARRTGAPAPLRAALEHHVRLRGDRFADLTWTETAQTLLVDGHPVDARRISAGDRWWLLRGERSGLEITVVGYDWHPRALAVETVADPAGIRSGPRPRPEPSARRAAQPADAGGEPHRALANAVLQHAAARAEWLAEGGPAPELPANWSALWRAAVRRQTELSDQPEPDAAAAVSSLTSHLAGLFHNTEWFAADDALRRRAVAEVLLFGTGLATDVPSRRAQEVWQRDSSGGEEWRTAWQAWTTRAV
jgi:hypothetical protein